MNICFKRNLGRVDQLLRLGLSACMVYLGFFNHLIIKDELTGMIVGVAGIMMAFFSIVRSCPMYLIAGINTCSKDAD